MKENWFLRLFRLKECWKSVFCDGFGFFDLIRGIQPMVWASFPLTVKKSLSQFDLI
jgi:hypothetical protein